MSRSKRPTLRGPRTGRGTSDDAREREALLPAEVRRAIGELLEAAMDMAQDAYAINTGGYASGDRVQSTAQQSHTPQRVLNKRAADHLERTLPRQITDLTTDIRAMLKLKHYEPRRGPRRWGVRA